MSNRVCLIWLENIDPQDLLSLPSLAKFGRDVDLRLAPLPPVERTQCYYQVMTGLGAGKLGRFDGVLPLNYTAVPNTETPGGAAGHMLSDVLRQRKIHLCTIEAHAPEDVASVSKETVVALIRVPEAGTLAPALVEQIIVQCLEVFAATGHVLVLTDVWHGPHRANVNINDFLADLGLLEVAPARRPETINWSETLAYSLGHGQVWVNLRGREPQGIVSSGQEYQEVCNAIIEQLQANWKDPATGEPIVERVFRREEIYSGNYLFKAPDLTVEYRPDYEPSAKAIALDFDGLSISHTALSSSSQAPYARMIGSGPSFGQGVAREGRLVDIVPTLLYLLGQPVSAGSDGNVLTDIFTPAFQQQNPLRIVDEDDDLLSEDEEGLIVDRLRDLGYLG